jgi:hypothetical protein
MDWTGPDGDAVFGAAIVRDRPALHRRFDADEMNVRKRCIYRNPGIESKPDRVRNPARRERAIGHRERMQSNQSKGYRARCSTGGERLA